MMGCHDESRQNEYTQVFVRGIHESKKHDKREWSIPLFVFEYFMQKNISGLIDETLEKSCLFHYNEADGHGII